MRHFYNAQSVILEHKLRIVSITKFCVIIIGWIPLTNFHDESITGQTMPWCPHPLSYFYIKQCWNRSKLPYCVARPQRVDVELYAVYINIMLYWNTINPWRPQELIVKFHPCDYCCIIRIVFVVTILLPYGSVSWVLTMILSYLLYKVTFSHDKV